MKGVKSKLNPEVWNRGESTSKIVVDGVAYFK